VRVGAALLLLAALGGSAPARAGAPADGLHALLGEGLRRNLAGDLDGADAIWAQARERHAGHPAPAVYAMETTFWRIAYDRAATRWDARIAAHADEAARLAQARIARDPRDGEAYYYWGYSEIHRARHDLMRRRYFHAGVHGDSARGHLERALALDPSRVDAKLPLGMYYYYASTLPAALRFVDWLWFVPTGDRGRGLALLEEVQERGELNALAARYVLSDVYGYFENETDRSLALLADLERRFPANDLLLAERMFLLLHAERWADAARAAQAVETRVDGRVDSRGLRSLARIWRARAALHRGELGTASELLGGFGRGEPGVPTWAPAYVLLARGQLADARGARAEAMAAYRAVRALEGPTRSEVAAEQAGEYLDLPFRPAATLAGQ
jgi:hypothetical protein